MDPGSAAFWLTFLQIIAIDLLLSGDNAVVIALACRNLPPAQRRLGVVYGVVGAVSLRVLLAVFAVYLLGYPWLRLGGGLLLLWLGVRLLRADQGATPVVNAAASLASAVRTIILADVVMSLDNVVAVAGAARGSVLLLGLGLMVSVPLMIGSSQLILHFMQRHPLVVTLGAALLGYVGMDMMLHDAALHGLWPALANLPGRGLLALVGSLLVVAAGRWLPRQQADGERAAD